MGILDYLKNLFSNNKKTATIYTTTLKKRVEDKEPLEIALYGGKTPIANEEIGIEVNNKQYIKKTDEDGVAKLNINLPVGKYTAKVYWRGNSEYNKTTAYADVLIITDTYMDGINLTKNEGDSTPYQCALYRKDNQQRIKDNVTIKINGVSYVRSADNDGLYKLNINLNKGTYKINATYGGNQYFNPSSINNTITINEKPPEPEPVQPTPQKTYSEEILEYFESKFGEMSCIDDCLEAIQGNGYGYYYDDQYSNYTSINRMANGQGVNCTDSCQVFWHLGKALGYDVRCLHIGCSGGDGHVRLQFNKGDGWFNRDPASVLNGNSISSIWCSSGTLWATNPSWFLENVNR